MAHSPQFRGFVRALQVAQRKNIEVEGKLAPLNKEEIGWTRRRFIKAAVATTGAGLVTSTLPAFAKSGPGHGPEIAVVGGGIAGLNAAYQLKKLGLRATVFEARSRLGGRIATVKDAVGEGLVVDLGGHFVNTDHQDIMALIDEFRLELFNREEDSEGVPGVPEAGYFFEGHPISEHQLASDLGPLAWQIGEDAHKLDRDYDTYAPEFDALSVADYLNQHADKIPEPFVRRLIEAIIRSEYGVDNVDSSALQLLFILPTVDGAQVEALGTSDEAFSVQGGSGRIIKALAAALEGQIRTRMQLRSIESHGRGFRLRFRHQYEVHADYVILAMPFTVLRHVRMRVDLPKRLRRFIREVDLGSNEKLIAGFSEKVWRHQGWGKGFVEEMWADLGFSVVWDGTQRQADREDGALTFFLGGGENGATLFRDATLLGKDFLDRSERAIPGIKAASNGKFLRTDWTTSPFSHGAYVNYRPGQLTEFADFFYIEADDPEESQDVNIGNLVFAGEHLSDEFYGFMNGGAQTGRLAANVVARRIAKAFKKFNRWEESG